MHPDNHTHADTVANNGVCLYWFFFVSLEMSLFPSIFVPLSFHFCMESTSYVFSFRMVFFQPCGHGLGLASAFCIYVRYSIHDTVGHMG